MFRAMALLIFLFVVSICCTNGIANSWLDQSKWPIPTSYTEIFQQGGTENNMILSSTKDTQTNFVVIGNFSGVLDLGTTELCKYKDENGNVQLTQPLNQYPPYIIYSLNKLQLPNVIFCYNIRRSPLVSMGENDILISKYNSTNGLVWSVRGGGMGNDIASSIAISSTFDVIASGIISGGSKTQPTFDSRIIFPGMDVVESFGYRETTAGTLGFGQSSIFLVKYNSGGKLQWKREAGRCARGKCSVHKITVDFSGGILLIGSFDGWIELGSVCSNYCNTDVMPSSTITTFVSPCRGNSTATSYSDTCSLNASVRFLSDRKCPTTTVCQGDGFIAKYDPIGNLVWVKDLQTRTSWQSSIQQIDFSDMVSSEVFGRSVLGIPININN